MRVYSPLHEKLSNELRLQNLVSTTFREQLFVKKIKMTSTTDFLSARGVKLPLFKIFLGRYKKIKRNNTFSQAIRRSYIFPWRYSKSKVLISQPERVIRPIGETNSL